MTLAKKAYYEFKINADALQHVLKDPIHNYVSELERVNAEMLEALIVEYRMAQSMPIEYEKGIRLKSIIESATGLPIEEAQK